jgi:hypothetical protein
MKAKELGQISISMPSYPHWDVTKTKDLRDRFVRRWENVMPAFEPIESESKKKRKWVMEVLDSDDSEASQGSEDHEDSEDGEGSEDREYMDDRQNSEESEESVGGATSEDGPISDDD